MSSKEDKMQTAQVYKYSIVLPVCNEEKTLQELFRRLENVMKKLNEPYEIICVDDGSKDRSFEILEKIAKDNAHYKIVKLSRNFGHQIALTAGLDIAQGEAAITLDADLQDPPEVIPNLIEKWKEGYDLVYATRKQRAGNFLRNIVIKAIYRIINKITEIGIPVDAGDFRLMSRRVIDVLKEMRERSRYLRGLSCWTGFKQIGVEYRREKRFAGGTKYPFHKLTRLALEGITSFSHFPLQIAIYLGFFMSIFAAVMIIYLIIVKRQIHGWFSVMVSILLMGGVQLFAFGVLGEYVGRIYDEVKQRPIYLVDKKLNI